MFIDRLVSYLEQNMDVNSTKLVNILMSCEVFNVDNISEYYWQNTRNDWHIINDFPNVAPVFPQMFLEWKIPQKVCVNGETRISSFSPICGYLIDSQIMNSKIKQECEHIYQINIPDNVKWLCAGTEYIESPNGPVPIITNLWWVKFNGECWLPPYLNHNDMFLYPIISANKAITESINKGTMDHGEALNIPFFTLCFLHCKNVSIRTIGYPESLNTRRIKRGRHPLLTYHILDIEPMKKTLSSVGSSKEKGIQHAMHICRGHFKDFSKGKGLFGKHKDIYWWESYVRGNIKNGISLKDYNVKLNEGNI